MPTLDWLNRDAAFEIGRKMPYRLLEQVSEHTSTTQTTKAPPHKGSEHEKTASRQSIISGLEPTSNEALSDQANVPETSAAVSAPVPALAPTEHNLLIQGDNLEALKSLLPFYRGQVKCIFIDPPYNTKSAFEHYDDNLEHAQWLTMMLPRLQLLRELLSEDGSIWVTIDDNEGHYLKVLMDEVFGRRNFVANCVWQKRYARDNNAAIGSAHDHVLVFARNSERFSAIRNLLEIDEKTRIPYKNPNDDPLGDWQSISFTGAGIRPNQGYAIVAPNGQIHYPPEGRHWATLEPEYQRLKSAGRFWFGKDGGGVPRQIRYLSEVAGLVPMSWWPHEEVGHNDEAKKEIHELFTKAAAFDTPKPERLIQRVIAIASDEGDLILDSFLGSGTTAAVAQKMGRRWIGIEMGEHAQTHCVPRLQKVLDGEQGGISKAVNWQGGGSFRFMRLGAPIFDDSGAIHPEVKFATLAAFVWMQETRTPWRGMSPPPSRGRLGGGWGAAAIEAPDATKNHPHPNPPLEREGTRTVPSPLLGTHDGVAYYLLFNGILGDRRPQGGNVLTSAILAWLNDAHPHPHSQGKTGSPRVIYGESVRLGPARLAAENITFKQIPYDVARG